MDVKIPTFNNPKILHYIMTELHVPIDKEIVEKLEKVKEYHGIKNNTEIIRFLITKEYRDISV